MLIVVVQSPICYFHCAVLFDDGKVEIRNKEICDSSITFLLSIFFIFFISYLLMNNFESFLLLFIIIILYWIKKKILLQLKNIIHVRNEKSNETSKIRKVKWATTLAICHFSLFFFQAIFEWIFPRCIIFYF